MFSLNNELIEAGKQQYMNNRKRGLGLHRIAAKANDETIATEKHLTVEVLLNAEGIEFYTVGKHC